jgi:hypothetical protein
MTARAGSAAAAAPAATGDLRLTGRISGSSDPSWDMDRTAWNLAVDQRPDVVARPSNVADVATIVDFAGRHGLRVAPQGTGHGAGALGDLTDTILLRTDDLRDVEVDAEGRWVRVGAGVTWGGVSRALAPFGLAALAGSSHDVGYTLGGGVSWLARRYGLAASHVRAVEMVTGDGRVHHADATVDPDLFWSARGGGGTTGVVTAIEFDVLPIGEIFAGAMLFPLERAAQVLHRYADWSVNLDESATTCIRLLRLPPLPDLPDFLRGKSFVTIDGAIELPAQDAATLLTPLRALGPAVDTFAVMPAAELDRIHLDPLAPVPFAADGLIIGELTPEVIAVLLDVAGPGVRTSLVGVELRHLGGAAGRPDPQGGCVNHLPGAFLIMGVGIAPTPDIAAAVAVDAAGLRQVLAPWAVDRDYRNFRDIAVPASSFHSVEDLARLRLIRDEHDPDGVIRSNHPLD